MKTIKEKLLVFKCKKNCAECCGIIPFPKKLAKETEHLAQVKPKEVLQDNQDKLYIITEDMKCVYLNRETKECMIYDKRPRICRLYGLIPACPCPYFKINGEKRALWERQLVQTQINQTVDRSIEQVKNAK